MCSNCFHKITEKEDIVKCNKCGSSIHADCVIGNNDTLCDICYGEKEDEVNHVKFEVPAVIRRSYIKEYDDCPYKFYAHQVLGIEQDMNIYAQMGIDLHDLFEKGCTDSNYIQSDMIREFNKIFDNYNPEMFLDLYGNTTSQDMKNKGLDSIETFYSVIADMPKPFKTEGTIQFSVGEGLPMVQATLDRINKIDGELEVIDWKTGNVMVGKALSSDLQVPLYIYATQQEYGLPVRKFTLYYLSENKTRVYERINEDNYVCTVGKREYKINITDVVRKVQHIFSQIVKGNFNIPVDTKGMYFTCKTCHIKKAGKCEGAEIQVWNQFQ